MPPHCEDVEDFPHAQGISQCTAHGKRFQGNFSRVQRTPRGGLFRCLQHGHFSYAHETPQHIRPRWPTKPHTQPHPCHTQGWGFLFLMVSSYGGAATPLPPRLTTAITAQNSPGKATSLPGGIFLCQSLRSTVRHPGRHPRRLFVF